jgi:geranylgeranylglycerol-phosphate geranylgeranyltransferase
MFIMLASLVYNGVYLEEDFNPWTTAIIMMQVSLTLALLNAASNALNQSTDVEADTISKPYRPIPKGIVARDEAQSLAFILYLFVLLRAFTINEHFTIIIFLIIIFTFTYSFPPRIKQYLMLNQIWIAIPRGLLGILASWSVFGDPLQNEPLIIGLIAMIYFVGSMTTKDIVDRIADKQTGTHTLVNTYGLRKAAFISLPFLVGPFAAIPILISYGLLNTYLSILTIFIIPSFYVFYLMLKHHESKSLENVQAWVAMYINYLIFAIVFTSVIIFGELGIFNGFSVIF